MPSTSPFAPLLDGLRAFHARVEGTEGPFRLALLASGQPAQVPEIGRSTLESVRGLLVWLRDGILEVERSLPAIDAVLALGDVAGAFLQAIGTASSALVEVDGTADFMSRLADLGEAIEAFPTSELLPTPELVAELRAVLEQLVGPADTTAPGSLDELLGALENLVA